MSILLGHPDDGRVRFVSGHAAVTSPIEWEKEFAKEVPFLLSI
jgi:hypothetical protein